VPLRWKQSSLLWLLRSEFYKFSVAVSRSNWHTHVATKLPILLKDHTFFRLTLSDRYQNIQKGDVIVRSAEIPRQLRFPFFIRTESWLYAYAVFNSCMSAHSKIQLHLQQSVRISFWNRYVTASKMSLRFHTNVGHRFETHSYTMRVIYFYIRDYLLYLSHLFCSWWHESCWLEYRVRGLESHSRHRCAFWLLFYTIVHN
jgi:hypothetical protein